ncbi:hypothetical protein NA56DRAFT_701582 [Hyaloscypha hepaticicola]|uniref:Uncharacterized protein n=1 Tax=Hyaloscypha hepaticicola TaxID=2082293 RepID=A0A2J6QAJ6_9HELO|nr:hypothetical protein NA56DRAFT_701582 [Hyaloscypha hepaticicola]
MSSTNYTTPPLRSFGPFENTCKVSDYSNYILWTLLFLAMISCLILGMTIFWKLIFSLPNEKRYNPTFKVFLELAEKTPEESEDRFLDSCVEFCRDNEGIFRQCDLGKKPQVHGHFMKMEAKRLLAEAKTLEDKAEEKVEQEMTEAS